MGLQERRAVKKFQDDIFPGLKKKVDEAAAFEVAMEIDWESLGIEEMTHLYEDSFPKVYFQPLINGFKEICIDDMGKEALRAGLKKVVICNRMGNYSAGSAINFDGGVLTIDHLPTTNIDDVRDRTKAVVEVISKKL
ncbi:MAG: hypothetical protein RDV48_29320 [Candidatus Eremiobacteraeota bacterium]|nr:hypothetical protein [Candidatus Eremiobacteraeota bacterium]